MHKYLALALLLISPIISQGQSRTAERAMDAPVSQLTSAKPNDSLRYVINGVPGTTPCQDGGTGAFGFKIAGVWHCPDFGEGSGSGSVTSVAMTVPSILSISGSPITTTGILALSLSTQAANTVLAGPPSGGAAVPTFRTRVAADLGSGGSSATDVLRFDLTWGPQTGGVTSVFGRTGVVVAASNDYAFSQVSGSVTNAQLQGFIATNKMATLSGTGGTIGTTVGVFSTGKCLEWDASGNIVTGVGNASCGAGGTGAPTDASYITKVAEAGLSNEFSMATLATGLVKNTITTGVPSIAVAGTDYLTPTGAETVSNHTLDNTNTAIFKDSLFTLQSVSSVTKQARFDLSNIGIGNTRIVVIPNNDSTTVVSDAGVTANLFLTSISAVGNISKAQPAFTNLSGSLATGQLPAFAGGQVTSSAGSAVLTIGASSVTNAMLAGSIAYSKLIGTDIVTVGTITSGVWTGTTIAIANGGTGQTTQLAAFNALDPITTKGDLIVHNGTNSVRLAVGTNGQLLQADSTVTEGVKWATVSGSGTVTVVGAGSLTSTAIVTGGSGTTLQTPSATATLDSSGNFATPGTASFGTGTTEAGIIGLSQGTAQAVIANSVGLTAPASVTSYNLVHPGAAGDGVMLWANASNIVTGAFTGTTGTGTFMRSISPTATGTATFANITVTGTCTGCGGSGAPGGSNTQVQFNDGEVLGGDGGFTYVKATDALTVVGAMTAASFNGPAGVVTIGSGSTSYIDLLASVAPSTPAAGIGTVYIDSTSFNLAIKDPSGVVKHGVQTKTAVANSFATAISAAGVVTVAQPVIGDITAFTSAALAGQITNETGSGLAVFATSPALTTPNIGAATGTSLVLSSGITASSFTATGSGAGNLVLPEGALPTVVANAITHTAPVDAPAAGLLYVWPDASDIPITGERLTATVSGTTVTLGWAAAGGGGDALVANPLSQFATTTSVQLRGVLSDELGTGVALFDGATPTGLVLTNATGTAAGLTAGNVTTNANLTGHVISTGNAAVLGSFTAAQLNTAISDADIQPLDSDLTTIAGLTATTDNFIVSVSSAWASRTVAQVKTTLALNNVENTALSTWVGSANITTLGTVGTGTITTGAILGDVTMNVTGTDATGDTYYRDSGGILARLPIGGAGTVLTVAGGLPSWAAVGGTGTVTSVSVTTANGISGTVATATTTPAISLDISELNAAKIGGGNVSTTEFNYLESVTSDIQAQLDARQPLDSDLTAIAASSSNGFYVRTGAGSAGIRTIVGTTDGITVSNGDGVSANPTLALSAIVNLTSKTLRIPNSTTLPATCAVGDSYMDTDATTGQRFYLCQATDTWALQGDGGGGGSGTITAGATNTIPKYTASTTVDDSLLSDDATTLTYTGAGGLALTPGGTGAGYLQVTEGSTAPTLVANTFQIYAGADVAAGGLAYRLPVAGATGFMLATDTSGDMVISHVGFSGTGNVVRVAGATLTAPVLGVAAATSLATTGTAGAGFIELLTQSAAPAAPASGYREYADSTGRRAWIRAADGFTRTWDATLTANRVYTLPDASGTLAFNTASSETVAGIIEIATTAEINTGTDAVRAVAPDQFVASIYGEQVVQLVVLDTATAATTGDGKFYFVVPSKLDGMNLVAVSAQVNTAGTTSTLNVDLARCAVVATGNMCSGTVVDVLSTNLTLDTTENKSSTAAVVAVIDTANDDVATDQIIRVDIDAIHTTPSSGLVVSLSFRKP